MNHGTRSRYNHGCRCGECREANRVYVEARRRAAGMKPMVRSPEHSVAGYARGCRCEVCKEATSVYQAQLRGRQRRKLASGEIERPHGVYSTYTHWGCRCDECRDEMRRYAAAYKARKKENA